MSDAGWERLHRHRTMKIVRIHKNEYLDSLVLMSLSNEVSAWPGVRQAVVVMGTDSNRRILEQVGLLVGDASAATPRDLVIAAELEPSLTEADFLPRLEERLRRRPGGAAADAGYDRLGAAFTARPQARLVSISVPGEHAAAIAREALEGGRHVFCFSQHVSIDDEIALKRLAVDGTIHAGMRFDLLGVDYGGTDWGLPLLEKAARDILAVDSSPQTVQKITSTMMSVGNSGFVVGPR